MAQIVPFPLDRVRKSKEDNIYEEKHILHMIKNIRQNYPPSLWNTISTHKTGTYKRSY